MDDQEAIKRRARRIFSFFILFSLFVIYFDIFIINAPFISFLICPLLFLSVLAFLLFQRLGLKTILIQCLIGPPAGLLLLAIITPALGELHNQWLLGKVREWGVELRQQKMATGSYPLLEKRSFHGMPLRFVNEGSNDAFIRFHLFGPYIQTYLVTSDRFLERQDD